MRRTRRSVRLYLTDIIEYIQHATDFTTGIDFVTFVSDKKTWFAVFHALEIIGEASKHIPKIKKAKFPDIPWDALAESRNELAHEYFGITQKRIWKSVKEDLPALRKAIEALLADYPNESFPGDQIELKQPRFK